MDQGVRGERPLPKHSLFLPGFIIFRREAERSRTRRRGLGNNLERSAICQRTGRSCDRSGANTVAGRTPFVDHRAPNFFFQAEDCIRGKLVTGVQTCALPISPGSHCSGDNCVSISASVTGTVASWSITGQLNTIDHYRVFISQDGENLMWLADAPASATSDRKSVV